MKLNSACLVLVLVLVAKLSAECVYPCWTEIPAAQFTFSSFATVAPPLAIKPYEFSLPDPTQEHGGMSAQCHAGERPDVDLYRKDGDHPLAGPIYRNPLDSYVSEKGTGSKGIAVQIAFSGGLVSRNGKSLAQAVFFHDEPCYRASTEFGFDRYLKGLPDDATVYFYYEIHANCKPDGKCRDHNTGATLVDERESIPLNTPAQANSQDGLDWLYEAYLEDGGTLWVIHVRDPFTHKDASQPLRRAVKDFWLDAGTRFFENGAEGYVTATAERNGQILYSGGAPTINIAKIWIAK